MATLVAITGPAAAAGPALDFTNDKTPNPMLVEDTLTVAEHDRGAMSGPLEYYDDGGAVATLPAEVNTSQTTPVGLRFDKIDGEAYRLFPRVDGESDNGATWTDTAQWSKNSGASSSVSIADADADSVQKVSVDATVATGETATATFGSNVSITQDPNKRVLTFVGNVDTLASGSSVEVRVVDGDGDYRNATIEAGAVASANDVIANATGNGYVFQQRVSDLPLTTAGDGTFDGIQQINVVASENDAKVTIAGLDVDRKSTIELAEIERDTDGDSSLETTTITDYYEGGVAGVTSLDTLGAWADSASIMDLEVYDVSYQFSDLTDESEYSVNFSDADDYSYPQKLELYADLEVPSAIDLSHGTLTLEYYQGLVSDRYVTLEIASVDSSAEFGNVSDASYSDKSGSLSGQGTTAELVASASADTTYRVHMVALLQTEEVEGMQGDGPAGPTDSSGGGFFSTIIGKIAGVATMVLGAVGIQRYRRGS
ncbi:hypothetical protein BRC92_00320 [Halobacteriales archaeon QS_4_69_31]|nr:MAG: hypothetical protein BRC92_00320 [Halobacteriales archaeon QS_4_69_31]